jgi:transcriptional regulator with XRE-family HTH domain
MPALAERLNRGKRNGTVNGARMAQKVLRKTLRTDFGLALPTLAKMTGIHADVLTNWERNKAVRLDSVTQRRLARIAGILDGLARVIRRDFIATWLEQPNDACKELGAATPLDLFAKGDYETLEGMVWYLESGTPG